MTTELQIFRSEDFGSVRTLYRDGEPWFVAADVCRALEISNTAKAVARLDDDEKVTISLTDSVGRPHQTTIINEFGLYNLILGSRKPEAKAFKRWITHEVIPAIRRDGKYSALPQEETAPAEILRGYGSGAAVLRRRLWARDHRGSARQTVKLRRETGGTET